MIAYNVIRNVEPASLARLAGNQLRDWWLGLARSLVASFWHLAQFRGGLVKRNCSVGLPEVQRISSGAAAKATVDIFTRVNAEC